MSGCYIAYGNCRLCGRVISFNPHKVPSIRWPDPEGPREPLCRACATGLNAKCREEGRPEVPIHPDAYEPVGEHPYEDIG